MHAHLAAVASLVPLPAPPRLPPMPRRRDQPDQMAALDRIGFNQSFARDEAVFSEGEEAHFCYRIISGAVRTSRLLGDGRRHVTDFYRPGDLLSFEAAGSHDQTAEAVVPSVIQRIPRPSVDKLIEESPFMARRLLAMTCDRLAAAQAQMVLLGRKTAPERVATFLLAQADRAGARVGQSVTLPMTRADIADYLGLTIETVSRVMSRLRRDRAIDLPDPHHFAIRDADLLIAIADGDEE